MNQYSQKLCAQHARKVGQKVRLIIQILFFSLGVFLSHSSFAQQPSKIQQMVDAIKAANYDENNEYITDGKRTVWVKSYKKWVPTDLALMKKEDPITLQFLGMAAHRARYDVLEQLLPDYYRVRGGVKAFAEDIGRNQITETNSTSPGKR